MNTPRTDLYGTWPEPYEIDGDLKSGTLVLRNRFHEITHDFGRGGVIRSVVVRNGTNQNLFAAPMACAVVDADGRRFADVADAKPGCSVERLGDEVRVVVRGMLLPEDQDAPGIPCATTYRYRWGHILVRREFEFPADGMGLSQLLANEWKLRPGLGHFGVRSGAPAKDPTDCGESLWGRLRPGSLFDYPFRECHVPRHVVFGEPGCEGVEWFAGSDLAQWTHGICGGTGRGDLWIGSETAPANAVVFRVSPLLMPRKDLRAGEFRAAGTRVLEFGIGLPMVPSAAHRPFLHKAFNRGAWPPAATIRDWAQRGVRTAHFHHDGDILRDGVFWRDGTYPPFGPEDMAEFDRVIADCHRAGIRVTTYFSNKELHPATKAYQQHGAEWARLPDGETQVHNLHNGDEFGAQMCLRSKGWMEFFKQYVDTVLSHHDLDGVYYDWNQAIVCNNPAHAPDRKPGPHKRGLFPQLADSPVAHWDIEELVGLMEWTRKRVGPDGLVIIHNTMNPCMAAENFADLVLGMEWGSGKLSDGLPRFDELPFEWSFTGARSRAVIGYGTLEPAAPEAVRRGMLLQCLVTGAGFWPADDTSLELMGALGKLDLAGFRFLSHGKNAVVSDAPECAAAAYAGDEAAILVLANFSSSPANPVIRLRREFFGFANAAACRVSDAVDNAGAQILDAADLFDRGKAFALPPLSSRFLRVEPASEAVGDGK